MKSKAPLVLIEQVIMIVVFALTAAICLRMFTMAEVLSVRYEATDRAVLEAQNAAEAWKAGQTEEYLREHRASVNEDVSQVLFDCNWKPTELMEQAEYCLQIICLPEENLYLRKAEVLVFDGEAELFRLTVAGQKGGIPDEDR